MATLTITKTYEDTTVLFETDLDEFKTALETLFNSTRLDNVNLQNASVTSDNINPNLGDGIMVGVASGSLYIKTNSIPTSKVKLTAKYGSVGHIRKFHTFNGVLSIPRGWMYMNGDTINETDYEAIHGVGTYTTDDIASSDIDGDTLPDTVGYYILSSDDVALQNTISSASNTVDLEHNHVWLNRTSAASTDTYFNSTPTATTFPSGSIHGSRISPTIENGTAGIFAGVSIVNGSNNLLLAIDAGTASINKEPENTPTIYIIKVV